jgi:hypothetical protein
MQSVTEDKLLWIGLGESKSTKSHGLVVSIPALYSRGLRVTSLRGDRLP